MGKTAGIIVIGDEILSGKFADENAPFLIAELRALGVDLRRIAVIPDDRAEIGATATDFAARFDHVFTSGGVGPTHDDVTMESIAAAFGVPVVVEPRLEKVLRDYWGAGMAPANIRLAHVPAGCELVGDDAIWPVVRFKNIHILPGVPALFRRKFLSIRELFRGRPVVERRVYCSGEEGALAPHINTVVAEFPSCKLGSYPRFEETRFRVMITIEAADEPTADAAAARLRILVGDLLVEL
ncbi:MAG TPA: molybdopterin-binding protein [Kofleriaceae bacterium]|nr:molybdopterin-binding protein [Kofleriaceae bacterium]